MSRELPASETMGGRGHGCQWKPLNDNAPHSPTYELVSFPYRSLEQWRFVAGVQS